MADKLIFVTILIILSVFLLFVILTYLVIVGGNLDKTPEEWEFERQEEIDYLKKYNERKNKKKRICQVCKKNKNDKFTH